MYFNTRLIDHTTPYACIYLVLIAHYTSTHLVNVTPERPELQYIPLLEMYTEIALGKVYILWVQHRCTHHMYLFSSRSIHQEGPEKEG